VSLKHPHPSKVRGQYNKPSAINRDQMHYETNIDFYYIYIKESLRKDFVVSKMTGFRFSETVCAREKALSFPAL